MKPYDQVLHKICKLLHFLQTVNQNMGKGVYFLKQIRSLTQFP